MPRVASVFFFLISILPAAALPTGSVVGHCGSTSFSHTLSGWEMSDRVLCDDNVVAFWHLDLLVGNELVALREGPDFSVSTGDVELTARTDALYRFLISQPGYFISCPEVRIFTVGDGFGAASANFGPWTTETPCDLAHAVAVTGNVVSMIGRTYMHAARGAHVRANIGGPRMWDLAGQPLPGGVYGALPPIGVAPVPEPGTGPQLLLTLCVAAGRVLRRPAR